jgi:hypothetical protein
MLDVCIIVYLDDIVVFSEDPALHKEQVREVFRRLWKNGLFTISKKCSFDMGSIEYLSFIIGP